MKKLTPFWQQLDKDLKVFYKQTSERDIIGDLKLLIGFLQIYYLLLKYSTIFSKLFDVYFKYVILFRRQYCLKYRMFIKIHIFMEV